MFIKGYALSVKIKNEHLREKKVKLENGQEQRQVFLPFDSEYSLFIKNKNTTRAKVQIKIDGKFIHPIDNFYILDSLSSMEIERFILDGNLDKGEKLKFVDVTKSGEEPGLTSNGEVEVFVYPELEQIWRDRFYQNENVIYQNAINENAIIHCGATYTSNQFMDQPLTMCCNTQQVQQGVTIGGGESQQKFAIFRENLQVQSDPIILKLKLLPVQQHCSEKCIGCDGKRYQINTSGVKVICPICSGTGVMPEGAIQ